MVMSGDAVDVVARLKKESDVPLRSHGSLVMNRALMAAGLVDHISVLIGITAGSTSWTRRPALVQKDSWKAGTTEPPTSR
jgi:hypothetical protein